MVQGPASAEPDSILATNQSLIRLEPTLLAISAERIKQNLWRELETAQPWRGRVFVTSIPQAAPRMAASSLRSGSRMGGSIMFSCPM